MTDVANTDDICMCGLVNLGVGVDFVQVDRTMHARETPCYQLPEPVLIDNYALAVDESSPVTVFDGAVDLIVASIALVRAGIDARVTQRAILNDEVRRLRDHLDRLERMQRIATSPRAQREDQP